MVGCVAFGCGNRTDRRNLSSTSPKSQAIKTSFHKFPKDTKLRDKWVNAIRRKNWQPTDYSAICSAHFTEDSFDRTSMSIVRLRSQAVPTIFPAHPTYLQKPLPKVRAKRKLPLKMDQVEHPTVSLPISCDVSPIIVDPQPSTSHEIDIPDVQPWRRLTSRTTSFSPDRKHRSESPSVIKVRQIMGNQLLKYRKKICQLQQIKRRQAKTIATMKNVLNACKERNFILQEEANVLNNINGPNKEILKRQVLKSQKRVPKLYDAELRKFALTLHYYSPKAYNYVRQAFNTCLPHPKTLSRWYKGVNGKPGFTSESFVTIKHLVEKSPNQLLVALMVDEMAIRRHVQFDGKEMIGYIDMGTGLDGDDRAIAKDALVFMIVCINARWKIPVGYFFVDGISGAQRANLITQCLRLAHESGVRVVSLTFDGTASNFSMASTLGCDFHNYNALRTSFKHPETNENIYVFPDPCHMLKLVRNTLGEKGIIYDHNHDAVKWEYLLKLHNLQELEGLHLANKVRALHINFKNQKMKVRLATQLLSESVAKALTFCKDELVLAEFMGCQPTIQFIEIFNNLTDVFNSKNLNQFNFKKPVNAKNYQEIFSYLNMAAGYISKLKVNLNGDLLIQTSRKTGFVGFLVCIESLKCLYFDACQQKNLLYYIPSYKISQDHLELFFGVIRSHFGCNNNPTCQQFIAAYKKNLVHIELKASETGNCLALEDIPILHQSLGAVERLNFSTAGYRYEEDSSIQILDDTDHSYLNCIQELTEFSKTVVRYISGFVVKSLYKLIKCEECLSVLSDNTNREMCRLIVLKDRGGLIYPSTDVINVCQNCEKAVKQALAESGGKHLLKKFCTAKLCSSVLNHYYITSKLPFEMLNNHIFDQSPMENHQILLIKAICSKYIDIRLHYIGKRAVDRSQSRRQMFNKLNLFQGN